MTNVMFFVEVNMYVALWSDPLTQVTWCRNKWSGVGVAEREIPFILLQDAVPSTWFWSCYFKVKHLHIVALSAGWYLTATTTQVRDHFGHNIISAAKFTWSYERDAVSFWCKPTGSRIHILYVQNTVSCAVCDKNRNDLLHPVTFRSMQASIILLAPPTHSGKRIEVQVHMVLW